MNTENTTVVSSEATAAVASTEVKVVKTRKERLADQIATLEARMAKDPETLADLKSQYDNIDRLENVAVGTALKVKLGRAETTRVVAGTVVGVKEADDGSRRFKFYFGEGFDADTVVIQESQIIEVIA